jgi:hypothetical protein
MHMQETGRSGQRARPTKNAILCRLHKLLMPGASSKGLGKAKSWLSKPFFLHMSCRTGRHDISACSRPSSRTATSRESSAFAYGSVAANRKLSNGIMKSLERDFCTISSIPLECVMGCLRRHRTGYSDMHFRSKIYLQKARRTL